MRNISKYHNETQSKSPPIVMPTFNKIYVNYDLIFQTDDMTFLFRDHYGTEEKKRI